MTDASDLRAQLNAITRQARAWVGWLADSGVDTLPCAVSPAALLASLSAPAAAQPRSAHTAARAASGSAQQPPRPAQQRPQPQRQQPPPQAPTRPRPQSAAAAPTFARPPTAAARKQRLTMLAQQVAACTKCRLHQSRNNTAFSRGDPESELVFVGEGPGYNEDQQGLPFVGKAGQLLDRMIVAMGFTREEVYICNIVKCRPPDNRKPKPDEMRACLPYLQEQLAIIDPKAIVTLGATGAQGLLNTRMGVTRMRGVWKLYRSRTPLMPTFHPAYLLRQPEKKREVWHDLKQVMARLGKHPPTKKR